MAEKQPHSISLSELEGAVTSAVQQLHQRRAQHAQDISRSPFIMGRWIQVQLPQVEADAAAQEITREVSAKVAELKAEPFAASFPGGSTMGFVLREE